MKKTVVRAAVFFEIKKNRIYMQLLPGQPDA